MSLPRRAVASRSAPTFVAALALAIAAAACSVEDSEHVGRELDRLDAQVGEGVAKIERALGDRSLTFAALGEGASLVESAARELAALEGDPRASDAQRLTAVLMQARAYDDLALALGDVSAIAALPPEQRALLAEVLAEKAAPARVSARESFLVARALACRLGVEPPLMQEILQGVARHAPRAAKPCD
jgi:hypothetical protein